MNTAAAAGIAKAGNRGTLLLSTAVVALACAFTGANAQPVIATDDVIPAPAQSPDWSIPTGNDLIVGDASTGTLTVSTGGTVEVADDLTVGNTSDGTLTVQGGGAVNVSGNSLLGYDAGGVGTVTITGRDADGHASIWSTGGDLVVAQAGIGSLSITGGGAVDNQTGYVGGSPTGHGTVTISGRDGHSNGSTWTNRGDLYVGGPGIGQISVEDGGVLSVGGYLFVDNTGSGAVSIANGGRLLTDQAQIGTGSPDAHVVISGSDSSWESTARISVGLGGIGKLRIEDGATVSSGTDAIIGDSTQGDAVITGAGSSWAVETQFTVGSYANGTLRIEDGGTLTSNQGFVGANGDGSVVVTGPGSSWTVTDYSLAVGYNADGALTIDDGGLVHAGGGVYLGGAAGVTGTLTVSGTTAQPSVLETTRISAGDGIAGVTFDGAVLRALTDNSHFIDGFDGQDITIGANGLVIDTGVHAIAQLSSNPSELPPRFVGPGDLIKVGTGILELDGHNSYSGTTTVSAGSLWVDGDQTAATGLTTVASGATLGGYGTIGGNVVVANGGILTPGTYGYVSTLTINGNLVLNSGSILNYDFGQANMVGGALNDLIRVGGNLTLDGRINVTVPTGGSFGPGVYRVFDHAGALTNNGLLVGSMPSGSSVTVQTSVPGQVNLVNTPPPEDDGPIQPLNFWDGDAGPRGNGVVNGGDGVWHVGTDARWTEATGQTNAAYANGSFAIFAGKAGTVGVDNAAGAVTTSGIQFASDGYRITGNPLTLIGDEATVRVGDGTAQGADYTATIVADLSGSAGLAKTDLGTLVLEGANGYTGATRIDSGTLAVNGLVAGPVTVGANGRLTGTGRVGSVTNSGVIAPGFADAMGALTIQGDYAGNGGRLIIATTLGDDSSPSSRLVITGATSGTTQVEIVNRGGLGAQTIEGIKIIEVGGASNGRFVLDADYLFHGEPAVVVGAFGYRLYQGGITNPADGDWYLRSSLLDPANPGNPGNPSDPGGPVDPGDPKPPQIYQPGVPVYEVYAANLLALTTLPTLQQRVGNRSWAAGAGPEGSGIWGRIEGARAHANAPVSASGADQDIDTWKVQLGFGRVLAGGLVAGITASYGKAVSDVRSTFGNGRVKSDGYSLGAALTWYGPKGFYIDGQAQFGRYESDLKSDLLGTLVRGDDGRGEAFSLEAGKRIGLGRGLSITPQLQAAYAEVRFDRFTDPSGAVVKADRGDSLKTRWGITLDHQSAWDSGRAHFYGIVNLSYEWRDGTRVRVSDTAIDRADERLRGEAGLGATISWTGGVTLYGEVSGNSPLHDFGDSHQLKSSIGIRMAL